MDTNHSTQKTSPPRLFAVDTMALLYRSHFAMIRNPLYTASGLNVSGLHGVTHALINLITQERPDYLAVVSDSPEPTFRHKRYAAYKATREKMPDELVSQLPYIPRLLDALKLPYLIQPGFEADDIIGTLVTLGKAEGFHNVIVSGDKDYMQLICPEIRMAALKGQSLTFVTEKEVHTRLGCLPHQVIDLLALMGDSSDNVPGVRGVGPKTAAQLLETYGSLSNIYQHVGEIKGKKLQSNLIEHESLAWLSQELVTIDCKVPLEVGFDSLRLQDNLHGNMALLELLTELEFKQLRDRLVKQLPLDINATNEAQSSTDSANQPPQEPAEYHTLKSLAALRYQVKHWQQAEQLAVDTETTGLNTLQDQLVGISLATVEKQAFYIPFNHPNLIDFRQEIIDILKPVLENPAIPKVGHNIKFDAHILAGAGIVLQGLSQDTMIASHLVEHAVRNHDLDSVALRTLQYTKVPTEALIGKGKDKIGMAEVPIDQLSFYACEDADITLRLANRFASRLQETKQLHALEAVEMPLIPVLMRMERTGIRFDIEAAQAYSIELDGRLEVLREEIYALAGRRDFNINSVPDLQQILYVELALHKQQDVRLKKIKTGIGFSTDEETLNKLSAHPLPKTLLAYRTLNKLKTTYLDQLSSHIAPGSNRIHTSFHQTSAATGRIASTTPNLQNIPIRTEEGRRIRQLFLAKDAHHVLLSADYSQIELRIAAEYSGEPAFIEAFQQQQDIHRTTAAAIFEVAPEAVDSEMRAVAKEINFGLIYRMGADRLAQATHRSREDARVFIERFFAQYPTIRQMQEDLIAFARQQGYAQTRLGRRRYLPAIVDSSGLEKSNAEGAAINTPIQGTAAEVIKLAMIAIDRRLQDSNLKATMLLTIHDELVFDVPHDELETLQQLVVEEMEQAMPDLCVPLVVQCGHGANWLAAH